MSVDDFLEKLEGFYDNWYQAARDPARYAHIKLRFERLGENEFSAKQWYHYLGEENPYRYRWSRIFDEGDHLRVESYAPGWKDHNPCCDVLFTFDEQFYNGDISTNNCIVNGGAVKLLVKFDGQVYHSRDQGWKGDKHVWGSHVVYEFKKTDKPFAI